MSKVRSALPCVLGLTACGIFAPDDGVDFEWSPLSNLPNEGVEFELTEIERHPGAVSIRGTYALWSSCYTLELDHALVHDALELRVTQRFSKAGCPDAVAMAGYTITIHDLSIAGTFTVTHVYKSGTEERLALEGSL